jgi:WD40 repeat protein
MKLRTLMCAALLAAAASVHAQYNYPEILWSKRGHGDRTTAVRYSPDGQYIVSGGTSLTANYGSAVIWNAATGALLQEINKTDDTDLIAVNAVDFFSDGTTFVTAEGNIGGGGGSAARAPKVEYDTYYPTRFISVPDGAGSNLRTILGSSLIDVDISPDDPMIAYAREFHGTIVILDAATGTVLQEPALKGAGGGALKFSPDGQYLAAGDKDGNVRVFRTADWSVDRDLANRDSVGGTNWFALGISSIAWTADSTKVAVAVRGYGCGVRIWDVTTGDRVQSIRLNYYFQGYVDYVPGDAYLGVGSTEWDYASQFNVLSPVNIRFINTVTGEVAARYDVPYNNPNDAVMDFDVAPDGQSYVYGISPGVVTVARNPYSPTQQPPGAPAVTATATSTSEVSVTWTPVDGAAAYTIVRSFDGGAFEEIGEVPGTSYTDYDVDPDKTYLYKVAAVLTAAPYSRVDAATTVLFSPSVVTTADPISRSHVEQLRTAINAMRQSAGLGPATFTDPTLTTTTPAKAVHMQEIRDHLDAVRSALGLEPLSMTDPTISAGSTKVKAAHVQELRNACR